MLNERKKKILQLIIEDYISTAEPVGSRTIARKYDLGLSPATIRNEMVTWSSWVIWSSRTPRQDVYHRLRLIVFMLTRSLSREL